MSQPLRNFEWGSAFKDGKLYLFTAFDLLVVRPWPQPQAWRLGQQGPWRGARPRDLVLDAAEKLAALPQNSSLGPGNMRRLNNLALAFAPVPTPQRRLAAQFGSHAWAMHVLFTRAPGAETLARVNPALALGLAQARSLRPPISRPLRAARRLLAQPGPHTARKVAAWLGFDDSRAVVRCLRKLPPSQCNVWTLRMLREGLGRLDTHKMLLHLPAFNTTIFALLEQVLHPTRPLRASNRLATELVTQPSRAAERRASRVVGRLPDAWAVAFPDRPLPRLRSLEHARALLVQVDEAFETTSFPSPKLPKAFVDPPVPAYRSDSVSILPLATPQQLQEEGSSMRHCIGGAGYHYAAAVGSGYGYGIRWQGPEGEQRATAWIAPAGTRGYRLEALRGARNATVSPELRAHVFSWLDWYTFMITLGLAPPAPEPQTFTRRAMAYGEYVDLGPAGDHPWDDVPF